MSLLDAGKGEALVNEIMSSKMHYFSHDNYNKLKERRAEDGSVTPELVAQYETKDTKNGRYLIYVDDEPTKNNTVIYARVSTPKQKKDLDNQIDFLKKYCIANGENPYMIFRDIGSGMNEQRKGLNDMLSLVFKNEISKIIISHKDRLTRFGFGYLENICNKFGVKIEIVNLEDDKNFQEELTEDLIAIIHHFSMKFYGKRKNNCKQLEANANLLKNIEDK